MVVKRKSNEGGLKQIRNIDALRNNDDSSINLDAIMPITTGLYTTLICLTFLLQLYISIKPHNHGRSQGFWRVPGHLMNVFNVLLIFDKNIDLS